MLSLHLAAPSIMCRHSGAALLSQVHCHRQQSPRFPGQGMKGRIRYPWYNLGRGLCFCTSCCERPSEQRNLKQPFPFCRKSGGSVQTLCTRVLRESRGWDLTSSFLLFIVWKTFWGKMWNWRKKVWREVSYPGLLWERPEQPQGQPRGEERTR